MFKKTFYARLLHLPMLRARWSVELSDNYFDCFCNLGLMHILGCNYLMAIIFCAKVNASHLPQMLPNLHACLPRCTLQHLIGQQHIALLRANLGSTIFMYGAPSTISVAAHLQAADCHHGGSDPRLHAHHEVAPYQLSCPSMQFYSHAVHQDDMRACRLLFRTDAAHLAAPQTRCLGACSPPP